MKPNVKPKSFIRPMNINPLRILKEFLSRIKGNKSPRAHY